MGENGEKKTGTIQISFTSESCRNLKAETERLSVLCLEVTTLYLARGKMWGLKKDRKFKNVFESFIVQTITNINLSKEKLQSKNNKKGKWNLILQKFCFSQKSLLKCLVINWMVNSRYGPYQR